MAARVRLIQAHEEEASARTAQLRKLGYRVDWSPLTGSMTGWKDSAPDAFVIDLARRPSFGRMLAVILRRTRWARKIPLVFVDGAPEKVALVRAQLPDAVYTTTATLEVALKRALASPPKAPVVPKASVPVPVGLPKKLAIKPGMAVRLVAAPGGFEDAVGELPEGARFKDRGGGDQVIWFVRSGEDLETDAVRMDELAAGVPLWIAWQKKSSGVMTDLSGHDVLAVGRALGRVDSKIAAIDAIWTATMFVIPVAARKRG